MANILPRDAMKDVRAFYRARVVLAGSLLAIACGAIALLALVPAYAICNEEQGQGEAVQAAPSPASSADREEIARAQVLLRELKPIASSTPSVLEFVEAILAPRPAGVAIQSVRLARGAPGTLVVTGTAPSRAAISAYRAALSDDPRFESVSVPIGNLTGAKNDRFTVTITGHF